MASLAFPLFSNLPAELQIPIWQHAINAVPSRVVNIRRGHIPFRYAPQPREGFRRISREISDHYTSPSPIPSVLHACHNSRELARKRWQLAFSCLDNCPKVFFDFDADILWAGDEQCNLGLFVRETRSIEEQPLRNLRRIALDLNHIIYHCPRENAYFHGGVDMAVTIHEDMPRLEEIIFLEPPYAGDMHDLRDPMKTRVRLTELPEHEQGKLNEAYGDVGEFQDFYEEEEWVCPALKWMGWVLDEKDSERL